MTPKTKLIHCAETQIMEHLAFSLTNIEYTIVHSFHICMFEFISEISAKCRIIEECRRYWPAPSSALVSHSSHEYALLTSSCRILTNVLASSCCIWSHFIEVEEKMKSKLKSHVFFSYQNIKHSANQVQFTDYQYSSCREDKLVNALLIFRAYTVLMLRSN